MTLCDDSRPAGWHIRYVELLRDAYSAQCLLLAVLPDMVASASIEDLKDGFRMRLAGVMRHLDRLETVFEKLGERPTGSSGEEMAGLLARSAEVLDQDADPRIRDAGLIAFAQRVAEYVICQYATIRRLATRLGDSEVAALLGDMLREERQTNRELTRIAMAHALADAAH